MPETDVVVLGSGAAGLSAALTAGVGLFGAGNVVAHSFASAHPGGGGTLGPAVTFGHVAGKSVLAALSRERIQVRYASPAVRLIQDETGRVTGVRTADGSRSGRGAGWC